MAEVAAAHDFPVLVDSDSEDEAMDAEGGGYSHHVLDLVDGQVRRHVVPCERLTSRTATRAIVSRSQQLCFAWRLLRSR